MGEFRAVRIGRGSEDEGKKTQSRKKPRSERTERAGGQTADRVTRDGRAANPRGKFTVKHHAGFPAGDPGKERGRTRWNDKL